MITSDPETDYRYNYDNYYSISHYYFWFSNQTIFCSPQKRNFGDCCPAVGNRKVKGVYLYSAFIVVPHTQGAQVRITQCYLQITPYLPLSRKRSPDGAFPD